MTAGGWIIMLLSVGGVTSLFGWCIYRVLSDPDEADRIHGMEFETPDERESRK